MLCGIYTLLHAARTARAEAEITSVF